ncbi:hypothetical protein KM043_018867 [Ampulex compressa]|nr:hypothetical protein KM043_018867 [Ampulex compressa]
MATNRITYPQAKRIFKAENQGKSYAEIVKNNTNNVNIQNLVAALIPEFKKVIQNLFPLQALKEKCINQADTVDELQNVQEGSNNIQNKQKVSDTPDKIKERSITEVLVNKASTSSCKPRQDLSKAISNIQVPENEKSVSCNDKEPNVTKQMVASKVAVKDIHQANLVKEDAMETSNEEDSSDSSLISAPSEPYEHKKKGKIKKKVREKVVKLNDIFNK